MCVVCSQGDDVEMDDVTAAAAAADDVDSDVDSCDLADATAAAGDDDDEYETVSVTSLLLHTHSCAHTWRVYTYSTQDSKSKYISKVKALLYIVHAYNARRYHLQRSWIHNAHMYVRGKYIYVHVHASWLEPVTNVLSCASSSAAAAARRPRVTFMYMWICMTSLTCVVVCVSSAACAQTSVTFGHVHACL